MEDSSNNKSGEVGNREEFEPNPPPPHTHSLTHLGPVLLLTPCCSPLKQLPTTSHQLNLTWVTADEWVYCFKHLCAKINQDYQLTGPGDIYEQWRVISGSRVHLRCVTTVKSVDVGWLHHAQIWPKPSYSPNFPSKVCKYVNCPKNVVNYQMVTVFSWYFEEFIKKDTF